HSSHGIIGTVGLLFGRADDSLHSAEKAFENGDAGAAITRAAHARQLARDATKTGLVRLMALLLVLATAFAAWTWGRPFAHHALETHAAKRQAAKEFKEA